MFMNSSQYCYDYPRPALTVDMVVWGYARGQFCLLLIQRKDEPFINQWALPGGFVDENETTEQAACRELREETALERKEMDQLYTVSDLNRDPRGRTVSVVYYTLCYKDMVKPAAGDDAKNVSWYPVDHLPALAFDHAGIIMKARNKLRDLAYHLKIGPDIFQKPFESNDLIDCYNAVEDGIGASAFAHLNTKNCIKADRSNPQKYIFDLEKLQDVWRDGLLFNG
jgi:8-oxo-dGTP diphosphatase